MVVWNPTISGDIHAPMVGMARDGRAPATDGSAAHTPALWRAAGRRRLGEMVSPGPPSVCQYTCACDWWTSQITGALGRAITTVSPSRVVAYQRSTARIPSAAVS